MFKSPVKTKYARSTNTTLNFSVVRLVGMAQIPNTITVTKVCVCVCLLGSPEVHDSTSSQMLLLLYNNGNLGHDNIVMMLMSSTIVGTKET